MRSAKELFRIKLSELINKNGLNQTTFAKNAGFFPSQVNRWLKGENAPDIETLEKLAAFFGLPASALLLESPLPSVVTREPTNDEILERIKDALRIQQKVSTLKEPVNSKAEEILSLFSTLDELEQRGVLSFIRNVAAGAADELLLKQKLDKAE